MPYYIDRQYDLYEILQKAEAGDRDAMLDAVNLMAVQGLAWDDETGDIREKYVRYLTILAEQGCSDPDGCRDARIMLADVYARGKFVPQDAVKAIQLYESAAKDGALVAYEFMGDLYYAGNGVPRDYEKAYACYTKTGADPEEADHSLSTWYRLGELYRQGLGVEENRDKALACYGQALEEQSDRYSDDFKMPCLVRYAQLVMEKVEDKDTMEEIWHSLDGIRDYYATHPDNLEGTDITQEELEETVKRVKEAWEEMPEHGTAYNFDVTTPMSLEEFNKKIRDTLVDLEDKYEEFLVAGIENPREDRITAVQAYVREDYKYHVEIVRTAEPEKHDWLCFTPKRALDMDEAIDIFKRVLVDGETPDLSTWKDITFAAHHGRT